MNLENPNNFEELNLEGSPSHEVTVLRNDMQSELIRHECPPDDNFGECIDHWAKSTGPKFALIFDDMYKKNPHLMEEWEPNKAQILDEIHGRIFEMDRAEKEDQGMRHAA